MPPITLTMAARKGGVGRTTTTQNLAGVYAKQDVRVLCIDLDGQASLSRAFFGNGFVEELRPTQTAAAIFAGDATTDNIHATDFENISVVPAGDALEPYASPNRREFDRDAHILSEFIQGVSEAFDLVLVDTPPQTNVSTVWAALAASDFVLSPVPADAFGVQSIGSVLNLVASVQAGPNPNLRVMGYVLSMLQRNSVNAAYSKTLRQLHGSQVFDTEIPLAAAAKEAIAARTPLSHYKPRVKIAKVMVALADEIQARAEALSERKAARATSLKRTRPNSKKTRQHAREQAYCMASMTADVASQTTLRSLSIALKPIHSIANTLIQKRCRISPKAFESTARSKRFACAGWKIVKCT